MMVKEIGSEFMTDSCPKGENSYFGLCSYPVRYMLSGRTGLHLIAQELKARGIFEVALPAYCCGSMVAPFVDAGVQVSFYEQLQVCAAKAILIMDYFGYLRDETVAFAQRCREQGRTVIVDATQTAFSRAKTYDVADYVVVSYRKWFDCLCAAVYSADGFVTPACEKEAQDYVRLWRGAAEKKRSYCDTGCGDKQAFLEQYRSANAMLAADYIGCKAPDGELRRLETVDAAHLRGKRRENAGYLLSALRGKVTLMFDTLAEEDCPLHVPILVPAQLRDRLRSALTAQMVYCPAHWPVDEHYPYQKTILHDTELSLVCDQRYTLEDMQRQAEIVLSLISEQERG